MRTTAEIEANQPTGGIGRGRSVGERGERKHCSEARSAASRSRRACGGFHLPVLHRATLFEPSDGRTPNAGAVSGGNSTALSPTLQLPRRNPPIPLQRYSGSYNSDSGGVIALSCARTASETSYRSRRIRGPPCSWGTTRNEAYSWPLDHNTLIATHSRWRRTSSMSPPSNSKIRSTSSSVSVKSNTSKFSLRWASFAAFGMAITFGC